MAGTGSGSGSGRFLYELPAWLVCGLCRLMDALDRADWERFASRIARGPGGAASVRGDGRTDPAAALGLDEPKRPGRGAAGAAGRAGAVPGPRPAGQLAASLRAPCPETPVSSLSSSSPPPPHW
ncbi:unnamed protein product [Eretmochelys imbricata]